MITVSKLTPQVNQQPHDGFSGMGATIAALMREIFRRADLRQRLEAECGRPVGDREFLEVADREGMPL